MIEENPRTVLITGANKGLGYETAKQLIANGYVVFIGARDEVKGKTASEELGAHFVQLDVTDIQSVRAAAEHVKVENGGLDILVNNAGISTWHEGVDIEEAEKLYDTNVLGVMRVTEAFLPLLKESTNPVVVNVSSALGSFWAVTNPDRRQFHFPAVTYGSSKAAVSMLTVQYAKAYPDIKFNAVEPGFTATDLTSMSSQGQPVADGAAVIVRMAMIDENGPTSTFQEGDEELDW